MTYANVATALAAAAAATTTVAGPVVAQVDGIGTGNTVGLAARNTTASSVGTTVQRAPIVEIESHARVSGADVKFLIRLREVPTTGQNLTIFIEYSTDGGSNWSEWGRFTTSTPGQFVGGLYTNGGLLVGSGTLVASDADFSGAFRGQIESGALELIARATTVPAYWRSPTSTSGKANFKLWANVATRAATEVLLELCDGASSATRVLAVMGNGSILGLRLAVLIDTSTSLSVAATDTGKLITLSNGSAVTVNLPAGAAGLWYRFKNKGTGTATLTPDGSEKLFTTSQVASLALVTGDAAIIAWDGTDWSVL